MVDLTSVYSRSPSVVTRKTGDGYVLVPVINNIAEMDSVFTLNETGAFIWDIIDGQKRVSDIIEEVVKEFNVSREIATNDVIEFCDCMSGFLIIGSG